MGKSEFQTLAYTAKLAGMEESRLVMTMNNLNLRTIEACDGNKSYQESFKRLGISLQEFATLSPDKKIEALAEAERLRDIEKQAHIEAENARKAKYAAADATPEIKDAEKGSKSKSKSQYNDSSLAKIGGGGLTATRYDVAEKQLNESKKQSKLLTKIAENTEKQNSQNELLMR